MLETAGAPRADSGGGGGVGGWGSRAGVGVTARGVPATVDVFDL